MIWESIEAILILWMCQQGLFSEIFAVSAVGAAKRCIFAANF